MLNSQMRNGQNDEDHKRSQSIMKGKPKSSHKFRSAMARKIRDFKNVEHARKSPTRDILKKIDQKYD